MTQDHTDHRQQLGFFSHDIPTTTPKKDSDPGIPIYKVTLVREGRMPCYETRMRNAQMVSTILHQYLAGVDREHFVVMLLDQKNHIIGMNTVSMGSLTASVVHPRECFKPAILSNAASIVCGHNHPSSDPTPSKEDRALTARLVEAGKLLGISVLDHIIIGDGSDKYFSFADEGLL
jgi:DNA repair protein RadC